MSVSKKLTHGGPGRGQGRHIEPGYTKAVKMRFLDITEEKLFKKLTPRQRVEALVYYLRFIK